MQPKDSMSGTGEATRTSPRKRKATTHASDSDSAFSTSQRRRHATPSLVDSRRAKGMRIRGRLAPPPSSSVRSKHRRGEEESRSGGDADDIIESEKTLELEAVDAAASPLMLLRQKLSTRAFTSFASLLGAKWVNGLDFLGDRRVLWASRLVFAVYVIAGAAVLTLKRSNIRMAAAASAMHSR